MTQHTEAGEGGVTGSQLQRCMGVHVAAVACTYDHCCRRKFTEQLVPGAGSVRGGCFPADL